MSYAHCPRCQHAYHLARSERCPRCVEPAPVAVAREPMRAGLDPVAEIVTCAVALARALRRATPSQRDAARASLSLVRAELAPPPRLLRRPTLLATAIVSLLARAGV